MRIKDYLLIEQEFVKAQELYWQEKEKEEEGDEEKMTAERRQIEKLRGTPLLIGTLEEVIDENHGIVAS